MTGDHFFWKKKWDLTKKKGVFYTKNGAFLHLLLVCTIFFVTLFVRCPKAGMRLNYVCTPYLIWWSYSGNATSHGLHVESVILRIIHEDLDRFFQVQCYFLLMRTDETSLWTPRVHCYRHRPVVFKNTPTSTTLAHVRLCDIGAASDVVWLKLGHLGASAARWWMTKDWTGDTDVRWTSMTWSPYSCFTHSMPVFARFCRWFYVAFLQTFWGMRHSPAQLQRGFRQFLSDWKFSFQNVTQSTGTWEEEEGVQNLKWIRPISSELWFSEFCQFCQVTWNLTAGYRQLPTGLTKQLRSDSDESGTDWCCWESPSWELMSPLVPTLTCDRNDTHPSLQLYSTRTCCGCHGGSEEGVMTNAYWPKGRVPQIILGLPQVLTFLGDITKSDYKTWCSSIKRECTSWRCVSAEPAAFGRIWTCAGRPRSIMAGGKKKVQKVTWNGGDGWYIRTVTCSAKGL